MMTAADSSPQLKIREMFAQLSLMFGAKSKVRYPYAALSPMQYTSGSVLVLL